MSDDDDDWVVFEWADIDNGTTPEHVYRKLADLAMSRAGCAVRTWTRRVYRGHDRTYRGCHLWYATGRKKKETK